VIIFLFAFVGAMLTALAINYVLQGPKRLIDESEDSNEV